MTVADDDLVTTLDAGGHDLVVVSSSVGSGAVAGKFRSVSVPVLVWEPYVYDDMGMAGSVVNRDYGWVGGQSVLDRQAGIRWRRACRARG